MLFPDGLLGPAISGAAWAAAVLALAYAAVRVREAFPRERAGALAGTAGLAFALQLVHFPLWSLESGGRLLGATLAGILLGPWAGMLATAAAVAVKAALYEDGGLAALGVNLLNIAVLGTGVGVRAFTDLRRVLKSPAATLAAAMLAGMVSNAAIALALSVEMQIAGLYPVWAGLPTLMMVMASMGLVEGLVTLAWVGLARRLAPDADREAASYTGRLARLGLATTWGLALLVSPLLAADHAPLEDPRALLGAEFRFVPLPPSAVEVPSPLLGYRFPGVGSEALARALAGGVGVLLAWGVGYGAARAFARREP